MQFEANQGIEGGKVNKQTSGNDNLSAMDD